MTCNLFKQVMRFMFSTISKKRVRKINNNVRKMMSNWYSSYIRAKVICVIYVYMYFDRLFYIVLYIPSILPPLMGATGIKSFVGEDARCAFFPPALAAAERSVCSRSGLGRSAAARELEERKHDGWGAYARIGLCVRVYVHTYVCTYTHIRASKSIKPWLFC